MNTGGTSFGNVVWELFDGISVHTVLKNSRNLQI